MNATTNCQYDLLNDLEEFDTSAEDAKDAAKKAFLDAQVSDRDQDLFYLIDAMQINGCSSEEIYEGALADGFRISELTRFFEITNPLAAKQLSRDIAASKPDVAFVEHMGVYCKKYRA